MKTEIGLIGLGVMGKSLSRNLARNGFRVSLFNRHVAGAEENVAVDFQQAFPELKDCLPFDDLKEFVQSLETPRKIMLMVNAGAAVDSVLDDLCILLEPGDVVIDGGNSHFDDTERRISRLKDKNLVFIGAGVSGGEEGALMGPSIMPSGEEKEYQKVRKFLETIAARDASGNACCTYVGSQGSGHFVKMIHNGIEYVEMQLLAECYSILRKQLSNDQIADELESWRSDLDSYLLEITVDILRKKEGEDYLLDKILDKAGNKGTGNWATVSIANSGQAATLIPAALFARYLSFFKEKRAKNSTLFLTGSNSLEITNQQLKSSYQFARMINHYQGFALIREVSEKNNWGVHLSELARIWTGGCIIKSDFMKDISSYLHESNSLLESEQVVNELTKGHQAAKEVAAQCMLNEIHAPCLIEAVNYFHGLKTADSSANVIQAQRDYFGAHTYQRVDDSSGKFYHTEW